MGKKVVILLGSSRPGGNTRRLAAEFERGAREAGHEVASIDLRSRDIAYCLGCYTCQRNGGFCVLHDDMDEITDLVEAADVIVVAAPVYFYTWPALMKNALDRLFAKKPTLHDKTFYLLSALASNVDAHAWMMGDSLRAFVSCFEAGGNRVGGHVIAHGARDLGDIEGSAELVQAYEMGKAL